MVASLLTEPVPLAKSGQSAWDEKTARNFMNVFDWSKSEAGNFPSSDLPLSALYLLAAPSTSQAARDEVAARAKKGEKVNQKEVAEAVRKHKRGGPSQPSGLRARILDAVKATPGGLITDELKQRFPDVNSQTVATTTDTLVKQGWLIDSGNRRQGRAEGGRPAKVYVYEPNPKPRSKVKKVTHGSKVVDLNNRKIIAMIDDNSICVLIAEWAKGKSDKLRGRKAYHLIRPLIGDSRSDLLKFWQEAKFVTLADFLGGSTFGGALSKEQSDVAVAEGRAIALGALK